MPTLKKLWFYPGIDSGKTIDPSGVRYGKAMRADMHIVGYYGDWRERARGVFARKGGNAQYLLYVHGFDCIARTTVAAYTGNLASKTFDLADFPYWSAFGPKSATTDDVLNATGVAFSTPVNAQQFALDDGSGSGALVTQTVANGIVSALALDDGGDDYAGNFNFDLPQAPGVGRATVAVAPGPVTAVAILDAGGAYDGKHNYVPWSLDAGVREDANLFLTYESGKRFWQYLESSSGKHYVEVLLKPDLIAGKLSESIDAWLETAYPPTGTTYETTGAGNPRSPSGIFIDNASKVLRPIPFGGKTIENAGYQTSPELNSKMRSFLTAFKASNCVSRRNDAAHTPTGGTQGDYKVLFNIASGVQNDGTPFAEEATLELTDGFMIEYFLLSSSGQHIPYGESAAALDDCTGIDWQIAAAFRWSDKDILLSNIFQDGEPQRTLYLLAAYYLVSTPRSYCALYAAGLSAAPNKTAPVYLPEIEYDLGNPELTGEDSDGHIVLDEAAQDKQIVYRQYGNSHIGRLYRREFERATVLLNTSATETFVYRNVKIPPKSGKIILKNGASGRIKPRAIPLNRTFVDRARGVR